MEILTKYKTLIIAFVTGLLFNSCINVINFDESDTLPLTTLNCLVTPDTILKVNLFKTRFFLSNQVNFDTIVNCELKLWVNGKYKESLTIKNRQYQSKYKPLPGDFLRLEVISPDSARTEVFANSFLPYHTQILKTDTSSIINNVTYIVNDSAVDNTGKIFTDSFARVINRNFNYAIKFRDSINYTNYYRIKVFIFNYYADGKKTREGLRVKPNDNIFENKNETDVFDNDWDKIFNIFTDKTIDGQEYTVQVNGNLNIIEIFPGKKNTLLALGYKFPVKSELVIDLQGIDEALFYYLKTIKYNNSDLQHFAEPVQVFSNIIGGTGIFGSYTHNYFTINLPINNNFYFSR